MGNEKHQIKFVRIPLIIIIVIIPLLYVFTLGVAFATSPLATDDSYNTDEDVSLFVSAPGVLGNDVDVDDGIAILATSPATGTVDLTTSGAFTYTPLLDFSGVVTFSYYVSKTGHISDVGNVVITMTAVNDVPTLTTNAELTLAEGQVATITNSLLSVEDVDNSPAELIFTLIATPTNGVLRNNGSILVPTTTFNQQEINDNNLTYSHDDSETLADSFTFTVTDSLTGTIPEATFAITITPVNEPPQAGDDSDSTSEDTVLNVVPPGVLDNDDDVDVGDSLSIDSFDSSSAQGAAVTLNPDGSFTYNPTNVTALNALAITESVVDTFTYTIRDSGNLTDTATVSITVTGVNDPPTAVNDANSVNEDNVLAVPAPGVLSGDSDPDTSDSISAISTNTTSSLGAAVTINIDGTYTYNPQNVSALQAINSGSTLPDSFTYTVTDGHGGNDTGTVFLTVVGANDAPEIDTSSDLALAAINEDETNNSGDLVSSILASAGGSPITDADSGSVAGIAVVGVTNINGNWQYSLDGSNWLGFGSVSDFNAVLLDTTEFIRFVPNADFAGSAGSISFRAWDQTAGSSGSINVNVSANGWTTPYSTEAETATLTVDPINDAPLLDNSGTMLLTSIGEDHTTTPGDTIAAIIASPGGDRITDVDAGAEEGIAVIGVDNSDGSWQYSLNGGLNWLNFSVSSSAATLLDAQSRIRFVPSAHYYGSAGNISFHAWDVTAGNVGDTNVAVTPLGGTTAFSTDTETATLTVYSINDRPFLDLNGGGPGNTSHSETFVEDAGPVSIVDSSLTIDDVDDTNLESAQALLTNPIDWVDEFLTVDTTGTGITAVYSPTTGILSLTGTDSLLNYRNVMRTLTYDNLSQNPTQVGRIVEIMVDDGVDNSNLTVSYITISPENDAPLLVNNVVLPVNEAGSATIANNRLLVTDVDNSEAEIEYTLISEPAHGDLLLSSASLSSFNTFTQADIDNNLLDYAHDGSETTSDSFSFTVADGSGGTVGLTVFIISVNANNDAPVLAANQGLVLDEGVASTITSSLLAVTDVDNTAVELSYRLEISPSNGNLMLNNSPLMENSLFTQNDINNNMLSYVHDGSETTSDAFTFSLEDGSGGTIDSTIFVITINPINDSPTVDLNGAAAGSSFSTSFIEDGGAIAVVETDLRVIDVDNANLITAEAVIVNHPDGLAEFLTVSTSGTNITANYSPATCLLTLSGIDTVENYEGVLRTLTYNNTAQDPNTDARIVNVFVNDGSASSSIVTSTITINAQNDPLALVNNLALEIAYAQAGIIDEKFLQVIDTDNAKTELIYTLETPPVNGQLTLSGNPLAANDTFSQADIDNEQVAYVHDKSNTESDSFVFSANDGDGGIISPQLFSILIHPQPVVYLPVVLNNYVYGEPNDSACEAFSIGLDFAYKFLPDDTEDWYRFVVPATSNVTVSISNYSPADGQLLVYSSSSCTIFNQIGHDPSITPSGQVQLLGLAPGTYYVRVFTAVPLINPSPYTLTVTHP